MGSPARESPQLDSYDHYQTAVDDSIDSHDIEPATEHSPNPCEVKRQIRVKGEVFNKGTIGRCNSNDRVKLSVAVVPV